jgi:hypothetical protein
VQLLTLDAGLNLLWLGISVAALVGFGRQDWRRMHCVRWHRLCAVFLATIALFPTVSDTDDLFNFSHLRFPAQHHRNAGTMPEDPREKDSIQLTRLIESLDHWQLSAFFEIALALCFFALMAVLYLSATTRPVFATPGRAPPLA